MRRRGYATTLVADLSRWLLARGHRACFMYTDHASPTSNRIYTDIGYMRVCDSAEYRFRPACAVRLGERTRASPRSRHAGEPQ